MDVHSDALAAQCVDLVLKALVAAGGDRAIIRSGRVPFMTRNEHHYRMSGKALSKVAVAEIAQYLLPKDELRALAEIGETRYHLPHRADLGHEDFTVDVSERGGEICVDIEHHKMPDGDNLSSEIFPSRLDV